MNCLEKVESVMANVTGCFDLGNELCTRDCVFAWPVALDAGSAGEGSQTFQEPFWMPLTARPARFGHFQLAAH